MTREEAIWILNEDLEWAEQNRYPYISEQKQEALEIAIKALEQENVLDKIRAEIEQIYTYEHIMFKKRPNSTFACVRIDDVLQIIDKYKAESEE